MENKTINPLETISAVELQKKSWICPLLSLQPGADLRPCIGKDCAMWGFDSCGLIHDDPDLYDIVEAVNDLTEAVEAVQKSIVHMPVL